ncbi:MAG: GNAT family N-acetyltransferase [Phycisphaerales bacterium]
MASIGPRPFTLPDGARIVVRSPTPEDVGALIEHERNMLATNPFQVREPDEVDQTPAGLGKQLRDMLQGSGTLPLAALPADESSVLGRLYFFPGKFRKTAHHGHFGVSVNQQWRGRGVGRAMITALLDWATGHAVIEKVCLGCLATNTRALRLYETMGFARESVSPRHFRLGPGRYADDVQMAIWVKAGLAPTGFNTWTADRAQGTGHRSRE